MRRDPHDVAETRNETAGSDAALVRRVEILTRSGSRYRMGRDADGRWWMSADNVPNPTSVGLDPDDWWEIRPPEPWPPELGERIRLMAPRELDRDDPRRVPGGGNRTSPVRVVREPEAAAPR